MRKGVKTPDKNYRDFTYYYYYSELNCSDEDIIIKCDDDIVYLDTDAMPGFLNEIKPGGIYFPNIVNNDLCAYIQQHYKVHNLFNLRVQRMYGKSALPLSNWYLNNQNAFAIHNEFLKDIHGFKINAPNISFRGRISINMFGGKFSSIRKPFRNLYETKMTDEAYLAHDNYLDNGTETYIVPYMIISHFSFGPQNHQLLDTVFLEKYRELASTVK